MKIKLEPVLHRGAIDLRHQTACLRQRGAVESGALADCDEFRRRLARVAAADAADEYAELALERLQPALQRTDDAGGDAGRMPIHAHHRAERLEPERMRQPAE